MSAECWLAVVGYESSYEVSDRGRVRGLDRIDAAGRQWRGLVLRLIAHGDGHMHVSLSMGGVVRTHFVHRLVLAAFVGPCPEGHEVCHGNGRPDDNRLSNLRYGTQSANTLDRVRHGAHHQSRKTHCPQGHEYDEGNTYRRPNRTNRECRTCMRERTRVNMRAVRTAKEGATP